VPKSRAFEIEVATEKAAKVKITRYDRIARGFKQEVGQYIWRYMNLLIYVE
jgi:hypothetical protein